MTEQQWIAILTTCYFGGLGLLGFYLLWREWMRKEEDDREMCSLQEDSSDD